MNGNVYTLSDSETIRMIDYGVYYKNEADTVGERVDFYDSSKPMEEFSLAAYKKQTIKFDKEGIWIFNVTVQNKGGKVNGKFKVTISELLDDLEDITESTGVTFNEDTLRAEWNKVDGAVGYRVKVNSFIKSTSELFADMSDAIYPEFKFFDLVVVPYDESGYNIGKKMVIKNCVVGPEGYKGVVINSDKAKIDKETRTATLSADVVKSGDWWNTLLNGDNGFVGLKGNYGVGYYIETEFSASSEAIDAVIKDFGSDNIPQIVLFAEEINGNKTLNGGKGSLLSTGLGSWAINTAQPALHETMGMFAVHGPTRATRESAKKLPMLASTKDYPLLTQNGLRNYGGGKTYKYIVGTKYSSWGHLLIDVSLYQKLGNDYVEIFTEEGKSYTNILLDTGLTAKDVAELGTNIILMAENKYQVYKPTTTFSFNMPEYKGKGAEDVPETVAQGAVFAQDGSLTIANKSTNGIKATNAGQWASYHNYFAIKGNYGAGTYIDFEFTGYNMPQLILFADGKEGDAAYQSITNYGTGAGKDNNVQQERKGVVILNGLQTARDYIHIFGPNRMNGSDEYGKAGGLLMISKDEENGKYKELTRAGQIENAEKDYALTVGTFVGTDGKVWIDMLLKDGTNGSEICRLQRSLGITSEEAGSGDIIILPPFGDDGEYIVDNTTTCELKCVGEPYKSSPQNF